MGERLRAMGKTTGEGAKGTAREAMGNGQETMGRDEGLKAKR